MFTGRSVLILVLGVFLLGLILSFGKGNSNGNSNMITLTENNFEEETKQGIVVVDFWAAWCGPCHAMTPVLEKLAVAYPEIKFGKVNVDEEPKLTESHSISSIPSLFFYKDGVKTEHKLIGAQREAAIIAVLDSLK